MNRKASLRVLRGVLSLVFALTTVSFTPVAVASTNDYSSAGSWPSVTWHLKAPQGVASDAAGNVYVADTGNDRIVKFDAAGRYLTSWGGTGAENGKFNDPCDVACDPSGRTVYVTDTENHRVQQFTVDGTSVQFVRKWGKEGGPDYTGANPGEFNQPHGIALDEAGNVYVVDTKNYRVQKFSVSSTGVKFVTQWGQAGSDADKFLEPWAIDIGPNGWVYVLDAHITNCYVRVFDQQGVPVSFPSGGNGWGSYSIYKAQGKFARPLGIAVDDGGSVYVSDSFLTTSWVQKFTYDGVYIDGWGYHAYGDGTFENPAFLKPTGLDASGDAMNVRVLVADSDTKAGQANSGGDRVREFDGEGYPLTARDPLGVLGSHGDAHGRQDEPWDVAIGPSGSIYVADRYNQKVQRFGSNGLVDKVTPPDIPAQPKIDNGYFTEPAAVAYDPDTQYVFVAEAGTNNRIQRFTADLEYEGRKWGALGTANGAFNKPQGIAVGPAPASESNPAKRWVYVSDTGNNRIQIFDIDGNWRATINGLFQPAGIVVDPTGVIYCVDSGNRRVVRIVHTNATWTTWTTASYFGNTGVAGSVLSRPWGIALDSQGNVYVSDVDAHRIRKYSGLGGFITVWGEKGSDQERMDSPRGVDVSDSGVVYVADSVNDRFQAFTKPIDITVSSPLDGHNYKAPVTPSVSFGAGAVTWGVTVDGMPWTSGAVSAEGVHVLRAWATDVHGLVHDEVVQFTIDTVAPSTQANALSEYSNQANIGLTAFDGLSGIQQTYWTIDNGAVHTGPVVSVSTAGSHSLRYWSVDKAGNTETQKLVTFQVIDTMPPTTTTNAVDTYADKATITLTASDIGSPVASTQYRLDGGTTQAGTTVNCATLGAHTLQYWSTDTAGNVESAHTKSFSVKRKTAVSVSRSASTVGYGGSATVKATLKAAASGTILKNKPAKLYRSYDGSTWTYVKTITSSTGSYSYTQNLYRKTYFRWSFAGDSTCVASSASTSVNAKAYLTAPRAPTTTYRNWRVSMYGFIKPGHTKGSTVVKLYGYRYENRKWVLRTTGYATASNYSSYSKYTGSLVFKYAGKWKVRAYHSDSNHAATYSASDYLTVK